MCFQIRLVCFISLVVLFACGKRDPQPEKKQEKVTTSVQGKVLAETGTPATGVTVKAGGQVALTDAQGEFHFRNVVMDKDNGYVAVTHPEYFPTGMVFAANEGNNNSTEIQLIPKEKEKTVSSSTGGDVSLPSGLVIQLPANGFIKQVDKSPYHGDVYVFATYVSPAMQQSYSLRPGGFTGYDKTGRQRLLSPLGIVAVELESPGGEKLQLANGKVATIQIPVPAYGGSVPAYAPLWYFDTENGTWKEEGNVTRQNNKFIGQVSHFSFWSADVPLDQVYLTLRYQDMDGEPVPFCRVASQDKSRDSTYTSAFAYTDSSGLVRIAAPSGTKIMVYLMNANGKTIHRDLWEGFTEDTDLGVRNVNLPKSATIRGVVTGPNSLPLPGGKILVDNNGQITTTVANNAGNYEITIPLDNNRKNRVMLMARDTVRNTENPMPRYTTIARGDTFYINQQTCCLSSEVYLEYSIDSKQFSLASPKDSIVCGRFVRTKDGIPYDTTTDVITYTRSRDQVFFFLAVKGQETPGLIRGVRNLGLESGDSIQLQVLDQSRFPIIVEISEYGTPGQFIAGTFRGTVRNNAAKKDVFLQGRFRQRRRQ